MLLQQQMWLAAAFLKCPNQNEQQGAAAVYAVRSDADVGAGRAWHDVLGKGKAESRGLANGW
jgi:hypothetical protein